MDADLMDADLVEWAGRCRPTGGFPPLMQRLSSAHHPADQQAAMRVETPSIDLPGLVDSVATSVVSLPRHRHAGSGVLWRNNVVVSTASTLWRHSEPAVILPDGSEIRGQLRGTDPETDLAAVSIPDVDLPAAKLADGPSPRAGDFVFAVGRDPSGMTQASFGHVGAVAGEWRSWRGGRMDSLIRLDGGLYPGYSGAPVAAASGNVLGIASDAFSRRYGIIIPAATVERVLEELLSHGRVQRGYLGVAVQPVQTEMESAPVDGLLVSSVAPDGPAATAGVRVGDVILRLGEHKVASLDALQAALQVGATAPLLISRGGLRCELVLEVAPRPASRCG